MNSIKHISKPWGHEEIWAITPHYVGKILHINPGHRLSLQYHEKKIETIRVLKGSLTLTVIEFDGAANVIELAVGEAYHINSGTTHRMANAASNEEVCEVLEISTPELEDLVRLEDDYDR